MVGLQLLQVGKNIRMIINCLPPLSLLKHEGWDPYKCLSSRKSPARGTYIALNLAEVVRHQLLDGCTLQSGVLMAVLHMEEQFRW